MAVLEGHEVVEDGVDGGREVVEEAGHVVQVLVDGPEDDGLLRWRVQSQLTLHLVSCIQIKIST